jgi:hypothetical protein
VGVCFGLSKETFRRALGLSRFEIIDDEVPPFEPEWLVSSLFEYITGISQETLTDLSKHRIYIQDAFASLSSESTSPEKLISRLDLLKMSLQAHVKWLRVIGLQRDNYKHLLDLWPDEIDRQDWAPHSVSRVRNLIDFMNGLKRVAAQHFLDAQDIEKEAQNLHQQVLQMVCTVQPCLRLC